MNNILVTGGAGFIGSNFISFLNKNFENTKIYNLDKLTYAGNLDNLNGLKNVFFRGDICDSELVRQIISRYAIDTIVHFAAESHVDRSINDGLDFVRTNVQGTYNLLKCAKDLWVDNNLLPIEKVRFHHISTDEVFGSLEEGELHFTENTPYNPRSPYSASKAASDNFVRSFYYTYGLPITITNCSNNYGIRQNREKLIPLIITNAIEGKELPVYGDGLNVRDWIEVEDHCSAVCEVIRKGKVGDTYLIGGGNAYTNIEVVNMICNILDEYYPLNAPHSQLIRFVTDRLGHDKRYTISNKKITTELGWTPKINFEYGLRKTIKWYIEKYYS